MGACLTVFSSLESWDSRLLSMSAAAAVSFTPLRISNISSASAGKWTSQTSETMSPPTVITGAELLACLGDVISDAGSACSRAAATSIDATLPSVSAVNWQLTSVKNDRKKNSESCTRQHNSKVSTCVQHLAPHQTNKLGNKQTQYQSQNCFCNVMHAKIEKKLIMSFNTCNVEETNVYINKHQAKLQAAEWHLHVLTQCTGTYNLYLYLWMVLITVWRWCGQYHWEP